MIHFKAIIKKFDDQGEKTGWRYIEIPVTIANQLKPGCKKSFRVKGLLDDFAIEKTALFPMGEGTFILPISAGIRKKLYKQAGDTLQVKLEEDNRKLAYLPTLPNAWPTNQLHWNTSTSNPAATATIT